MTDERELYWLAGLLEGEGSFVGGLYGTRLRMSVDLVMTDRDTVERAAKAFPGSTPVRARKPQRDGKQLWVTHWCGENAANLMFKLVGNMSERRTERMVEVVTFWLQHRKNYRKDIG